MPRRAGFAFRILHPDSDTRLMAEADVSCRVEICGTNRTLDDVYLGEDLNDAFVRHLADATNSSQALNELNRQRRPRSIKRRKGFSQLCYEWPHVVVRRMGCEPVQHVHSLVRDSRGELVDHCRSVEWDGR